MTDHADLIARMEEIATRPDCTYPGHMLDAAMVIKALVNDVRVLKADLDRSEDNVSRLIAERDEARALLREARAAMLAVVTGDYPNPRDHRPGECKHGTFYWVDCGQCIDEWLEAAVARIDALLTKTEGTT